MKAEKQVVHRVGASTHNWSDLNSLSSFLPEFFSSIRLVICIFCVGDYQSHG